MEINEYLRNKRQELGISQDKISQALGYAHRSEVHKLETGKLEWRLKHIFIIAKLFRISASDLIAEFEKKRK